MSYIRDSGDGLYGFMDLWRPSPELMDPRDAARGGRGARRGVGVAVGSVGFGWRRLSRGFSPKPWPLQVSQSGLNPSQAALGGPWCFPRLLGFAGRYPLPWGVVVVSLISRKP